MTSIESPGNQVQGRLVLLPAQSGHTNRTDTGSGSGLEVNVLFTKLKATQSALNAANKLAEDLGARIRLIVPQVVPFPLQLAQPTVDTDFTARKARAILVNRDLEAEIQVCLCREPLDAALAVLRPNSLLLIGGRRRFWPTEDRRLARQIQRHGHQVLFVDQG